ncbi:MAG: ABC transporter permease [Acidobacteriota bacterium]
MTVRETFQDALDNLAAHKLRGGLSMLGMIFGVGAVIAMLSIGEGAERQALEMIERLGLRNIIIQAKDMKREDLMEIRKKSLGLSRRDVDAIGEAVPAVEWVGPRVAIEPYKVLAAGKKTEGRVYGVSYRHAELTRLRVAEGRFLDIQDEKDHAQVCVIGSSIRRDLFGFGPAVGEHLKVNDVWLVVVGVLAREAVGAERFEGVAVSSTTGEIYLPFTTALRKFEHPPLDSPLDQIVVRMRKGVSPWKTASVLEPLLSLLHGGVDDYDIVVPEALLEQSRRTQRLFKIILGCIAGISLLVGGIGIMNIMLASVLERTREIGVRRAVGARRRDIRFQFLVESFCISLSGGLAGVLMGLAIARIVAHYAGWPTVVTVWAIVLSTGVSVTVGITSGLYPATRAAELSPTEALGYE